MFPVEYSGIFFSIIPFGRMMNEESCEEKQYNTQAVANLRTEEGNLSSALVSP